MHDTAFRLLRLLICGLFVANAAAACIEGRPDPGAPQDGGADGLSDGPQLDIPILPEGGPQDIPGPPDCDPGAIGRLCNPTSPVSCGTSASCLETAPGIGVCTCTCAPDNLTTPSIDEDTCPDRANIVCGTLEVKPVTGADGSTAGYCLKKCQPKHGENSCDRPFACHPWAGIDVGLDVNANGGTSVCLYPGCTRDADCPVMTADTCVVESLSPCLPGGGECLPDDEGAPLGHCALAGKCDLASGLCAPRTSSYTSRASVGDPCADDRDCGASMMCARQVDPDPNALATGPCKENSGCCSGQCDSSNQCVPAPCATFSRNGYCTIAYCAFDTLTAFSCPTGSVCNRWYPGGLCQRGCDLFDAGTCRDNPGDMAGDYECRAYDHIEYVDANGNTLPLADGPVCDWGSGLTCTVGGVSALACASFGADDAFNPTNMRCMGLDGADKLDDRDPTGLCLDDTASGNTWP